MLKQTYLCILHLIGCIYLKKNRYLSCHSGCSALQFKGFCQIYRTAPTSVHPSWFIWTKLKHALKQFLKFLFQWFSVPPFNLHRTGACVDLQMGQYKPGNHKRRSSSRWCHSYLIPPLIRPAFEPCLVNGERLPPLERDVAAMPLNPPSVTMRSAVFAREIC